MERSIVFGNAKVNWNRAKMSEIADIENGLASQDETVRWNTAIAAELLVVARPWALFSHRPSGFHLPAFAGMTVEEQ
jgi:hypothetical protein